MGSSCGSKKSTQYFPKGKRNGLMLVQVQEKTSIFKTKYLGIMEKKKKFGYGTSLEKRETVKNVQIGFWVEDHMEGAGELRHSQKKTIYKGQLSSSYPLGFGTCLEDDNNFYEGFWSKGKREGYGKEVYTTGSYIGNFKEDKFCGKGVLKIINNNEITTFKGSFEKGMKKGFCIKTIKNRENHIIKKEYLNYKEDDEINEQFPLIKEEVKGNQISLSSHAHNEEELKQIVSSDYSEFETLDEEGKCIFQELEKFALEITSWRVENLGIKLEMQNRGNNNERIFGKGRLINNYHYYEFCYFEIKVYSLLNAHRQELGITEFLRYENFTFLPGRCNNILQSFQGRPEEIGVDNQVFLLIMLKCYDNIDKLSNWFPSDNQQPSKLNLNQAQVLSRDLLDKLKLFERYNVVHGKIRPQYLFPLVNQESKSYDIKMVNFSHAHVFYRNYFYNRHTFFQEKFNSRDNKFEEWLALHLELIPENACELPFYPFDYNDNELYYLPPFLQTICNNPFTKRVLDVKHNILQTEMFATAVCIMEMFLAALNKTKKLKKLRTFCKEMNVNNYVEIVRKLGENCQEFNPISGIVTKMLTAGYKKFEQIPQFFETIELIEEVPFIPPPDEEFEQKITGLFDSIFEASIDS
jgi:hypothetical protein